MNNTIKTSLAVAILFAFPMFGSACDGKGGHHAKGTQACPVGADKQCEPGDCSKSSHYGHHGKGYHAKKGHHSIPGNNPSYLRKILKAADVIALSEKQRKQVAKLLVQAETGAAKAHAQAEALVADFRSKLHAGKVNDKALNSYTQKMGELRAAKLAANLKASVAAARLLSDEQKQKLYAKKKASKLQ